MWWQPVRISVSGVSFWPLLPGRLARMGCEEVTQVLVNDIIVRLISTIASCEVRVNVDFRFANPEWMCSDCVNEPGESGSDRH